MWAYVKLNVVYVKNCWCVDPEADGVSPSAGLDSRTGGVFETRGIYCGEVFFFGVDS